MTIHDREDRIECDDCDTRAEHAWHAKADELEDKLLEAQSKVSIYEKKLDVIFAIAALAESLHIGAEEACNMLVNQFPDALMGSYDIMDPLPQDHWRKP